MTTKVLITGANKGIGRATVAAVLGARNDALVLLGSRDEGRGQVAREALIAEQADWAERIGGDQAQAVLDSYSALSGK